MNSAVPSVAEIRELVRLGKSRYLPVDIEKGIYELVKDKSLRVLVKLVEIIAYVSDVLTPVIFNVIISHTKLRIIYVSRRCRAVYISDPI